MPLQATSGAASYDAFGGGVVAEPNYIESVFSTYLYTGNGSTLAITNGVDLSTKGGLVWLKRRNSTGSNQLYDTVRGAAKLIYSDLTDSQISTTVEGLQSFNSNGFTLGGNWGGENFSGGTVASWTFRKQPKFFDVVTYTGNGTARSIAHSLGSTPGCVIIKSTSGTGSWAVWHRSGTQQNRYAAFLNFTDAYSNQGSSYWGTPLTDAPDMNASTFSVGTTSDVNGNGVSYVAYLFAHNAGGFGLTGTDNVISCGSFTTDGSGEATVSLGYEPQWVLLKSATSAVSWVVLDTMRGWVNGSGSSFKSMTLQPNSSAAEAAGTIGADNLGSPTATGFTVKGVNATDTMIYIAIRRGPMKVPTSGTSVYENTAYTGNNTAERKIGSSVLTDLLLLSNRDATATDWSTYAQFVFDRLRGQNLSLSTANTSSELSGWNNYCNFDMNTGWDTGSTADQQYLNKTSATYVSHALRRAPSFFDEVCYTGDSAAPRTLSHNLGVAPELLITKRRSSGGTTGSNRWYVTAFNLPMSGPNYQSGILNGTDAFDVYTQIQTAPTSTTFTLGVDSFFANISSQTYVAYLFATCAGVSKVFNYTGNGSSQTINCGFTAGARWILIKRTDSTGDWYVWDSARGIVSGNDPHLSLNSTAAEVTTDDTIDTDSTGFVVNQVSATNVNVSSATYIGIAIA